MRINSFFKSTAFKILCLALFSSYLCACGGGGGGDDFIGAANVSLQASPTSIDTGDRMLVRTEVNQVNDSGIALKFKFPVGLRYVPSSSSLVSGEQGLDLSPTVNSTENNFSYLVYYLDRALFGNSNSGTVEFFLEGTTTVLSGELAVDSDVDNPLISNDTEFDIRNPGFAAESSVEVNVEG